MDKKSLSRRDFLKWSSLAASGALLAACAPAASAPTAPAEAPTVGPINLTMWTYSGDEVALADMFEGYKADHPNTNLEIVKFGLGDMVQKITTSLVAGSGLPDTADIEQGFFRKFAYGDGLLDLSPLGVTDHKNEINEWMWEAGLSPDKSKVFFLYYSLGVGVIHYRRGIFKKAGLPDDPDGVKALISESWPANLETGAKVSQEGGPWMYENASNIVAMYKEQYNPAWYDEDNKKFLINTPALLEGLKLAVEARKRGLDAKIWGWTPEWNNTFKTGMVATYAYGDWLVMNIRDYGGEETKGDWGMAPLPGSTTATHGGSLLCAFKNTPHKEEAGNILSYMTFNKEAQLKQLTYFLFPALKAAWDDPMMEEPVEWYGGQRTRLIVVDGARRSAPHVYTPYDDQVSSIFGTEIAKCLDEGKDPEKALADAQATAEAQIEIKS